MLDMLWQPLSRPSELPRENQGEDEETESPNRFRRSTSNGATTESRLLEVRTNSEDYYLTRMTGSSAAPRTISRNFRSSGYWLAGTLCAGI